MQETTLVVTLQPIGPTMSAESGAIATDELWQRWGDSGALVHDRLSGLLCGCQRVRQVQHATDRSHGADHRAQPGYVRTETARSCVW